MIMRREIVTRYIARDAKPFDTEAECQAYERENAPRMLAGLTDAEVAAALSREDADLADLLEWVGDKIKRERIAAGDRKRPGRKGATEPVPTGQEEPLEPAPDSGPVDPDQLLRMGLEVEGAKAFAAGFGGIAPDDLTPEQGQHWLTGWARASLARAQRTGAAA